MTTYIVNCLHLSGKGKKMFEQEDSVTTENFYEGQAEDYLKSGHLREPNKKEKVTAEKDFKDQGAKNKVAEKEREEEVSAAKDRDDLRKAAKEKAAEQSQAEADKAQAEADKLEGKNKGKGKPATVKSDTQSDSKDTKE